jgi:uroporphyrinogen-III synthase
MPSSPSSLSIPVLLLKTRSQPHDAYDEFFSDPRRTTTSSNDGTRANGSTALFLPEFVPVLEHKPNSRNLSELQGLLKRGRLAERHGGMIFTSQRAVEAWADVVRRVQQERDDKEQHETSASKDMGSGMVCSPLSISLTAD